MNKRDIRKIIKIICGCCALTEDNIEPGTEINSISLDSLSFVQMIVNLESEFEIEFEDEQLSIYDYKTVEDIIDTVEERINAGQEST